MRKMVCAGALSALTILVAFGPLQATLVNNGGGLIYDTGLGVTWYNPASSPYMTWTQAGAWAAELTVGGTTAGSWKLPAVLPVNGSAYNYDYNEDGSSDIGTNISAPGSVYPGSTASPMAYLYYIGLGNAAGALLPNTSPFTNLQLSGYWSCTEYAPMQGFAFVFSFGDGSQYPVEQTGNLLALAVHAGNVAVPIPGAILLLVPGLAAFVAFRRMLRK